MAVVGMTTTSSTRKVALITGGGRGIGAGAAQAFADAGYAVVIAERDASIGDEFAASLPFAICVPADVTIESDIERAVAAAVSTYGHLDVLVNNAGRNQRTPIGEMTNETWDDMIRLNLTSVMWGCRHALPHLIASRGAIVNVASLVGMQGQREAVAYSAAKGAVIAMTKTLALDHAHLGVRINCLAPGDVWTPMYTEWAAGQPDPEQAVAKMLDIIPAGRMGTVAEAGNAIRFLAENEFITGETLVLDGGKQLG
jgi:NAD(P)-dependent dehydrogenase (short-subunit alcohol dehydrogenase family)